MSTRSDGGPARLPQKINQGCGSLRGATGWLPTMRNVVARSKGKNSDHRLATGQTKLEV